MEKQITSLPKIPIQKDRFSALPEEAGVYIFWKKNEPIYIGKAINLKSRLSSYLSADLAPKTHRMVTHAENVSFIKVTSELESLLLEAFLVHKNQPKFNSALKDDKHPLYIVITNEYYPRILSVRKLNTNNYQLKAIFGPFPSSKNVYSVLRWLRRIFPYSDHKLGKRGCLYSHIGLCNPCPNEIERITNNELRIKEREKYLKNIKMLRKVLERKFNNVKTSLVKEMAVFSNQQKFEDAQIVRDQISKLDYITQSATAANYFLENPNLTEDLRKKELSDLKIILKNCKLKMNNPLRGKNLTRIECFDVAHLAGTAPTASMVTFINGEAERSLYRRFKIRQEKSRDDIASIEEVAKRRLKHLQSWGVPNLIIVDGGISQVRIFTSILYSNEVAIPVIGIAKNPDRLIIGKSKIRLTGPVLNIVSRIRNEAHRFARAYHHKLIKKSLFS